MHPSGKGNYIIHEEISNVLSCSKVAKTEKNVQKNLELHATSCNVELNYLTKISILSFKVIDFKLKKQTRTCYLSFFLTNL